MFFLLKSEFVQSCERHRFAIGHPVVIDSISPEKKQGRSDFVTTIDPDKGGGQMSVNCDKEGGRAAVAMYTQRPSAPRVAEFPLQGCHVSGK